jgi:TRAP-type C4-dicarboxylate transport system permease small subunit
VERALASVLLVAIVALVSLSSGFRYAGAPLIWADEVIQALFPWLCALAADLTLQRSGHFSVDMLANYLPARARRVLELINTLLVMALLAVLAYYGQRFARMTGMRPLPITGVTSAAATSALTVGFVLMLVTLAEQFHRRLTGREAAPAPSEPREVM